MFKFFFFTVRFFYQVSCKLNEMVRKIFAQLPAVFEEFIFSLRTNSIPFGGAMTSTESSLDKFFMDL